MPNKYDPQNKDKKLYRFFCFFSQLTHCRHQKLSDQKFKLFYPKQDGSNDHTICYLYNNCIKFWWCFTLAFNLILLSSFYLEIFIILLNGDINIKTSRAIN